MKTNLAPSFYTLLGALLLVMTSCLKDDVDVKEYHYTTEEYQVIQQNLNLPQDLLSYKVELPGHMVLPGMIQPDIDDAKATLGRVLFYDNKLSRNEAVSCASCHDQALAFSDDVALSEGFEGELTKRNSLPLAATANFESSYGGGNSFSSRQALFFWDERAHSIAQQSTMTIADDIEMGMDMNDLADRLSQVDYYSILFKKAYGSETVLPSRITEALEEFINSIVSVDSRFDEGMARHNSAHSSFSNFTAAENMGRSIYVQNCASCHSSDMSSLAETVANNGLDVVYEDKGLGDHNGNPFDNGVFKVPFLRNIGLTAPYMHDGRFATLEDVVEHYNSGIQPHDNLDFRLKEGFSGEPKRLNLDNQEKAALVAFLETLTDPVFLEAKKYSDPFN